MGAALCSGAGSAEGKGSLGKASCALLPFCLSPEGELHDPVPPGTGVQTCLAMLQRQGSSIFGIQSTGKQLLFPWVSSTDVPKTPLEEADGGGQSTGQPVHLEFCDHSYGSLAFVGCVQTEPKAVMDVLGRQPHCWASSPVRREETGDMWLLNGGGRKPCLGAGGSHIHSLVAKHRRV